VTAIRNTLAFFAKIEPLLGEIREVFGAQFAASFEKLIDAMPDGRQRIAQARERMKAIRAQIAQKRQARRRKSPIPRFQERTRTLFLDGVALTCPPH
jgi:hypothetical protein